MQTTTQILGSIQLESFTEQRNDIKDFPTNRATRDDALDDHRIATSSRPTDFNFENDLDENFNGQESTTGAPEVFGIVPDRAVDEEDVPPDGGYGWIATACAFLVNAHTWGINSAWAVFLAYYLEHSTFPDASRFEYAIIGGLSISQALIITPFVAFSVRVFGTRPTMSAGSFLIFGALLGSSFATKIWHLVLSQGICFGWGMGLLYIPASTVLPQWFSSKRSLAQGIASAGAGLGGLLYVLSTSRAIETVGLAWSYRMLAFCGFVANLLSAVLTKDRNKSVKPIQNAFNWREYSNFEVILVILWGGFAEIGYVTLLFSLPDYAASIDLSKNQASILGAMLNLGLGAGRPLIGYLSDRIGRINVSALVTITCAALCFFFWLPSHSFGLLVFFSIAAGVCCGIFWCTISPVLTDVVGLQRLPSTFGIICIAMAVPTIFGEPIALQLVQTSGYTATQIFVGVMFILSAFCCWLLRGWRIGDIEERARQRSLRDTLGTHGLTMNRRNDAGAWVRRLFVAKRV